jgi:single-strand DNA-binding protein
MVKTVNSVQITGHIGTISMFTTASGANKATLTVATNERYKDRTTQQWKTITDWHTIEFWGRNAEIARGAKRGDLVEITGANKKREYADKSGNKQTVAFIQGKNLIVGGATPSSDQPVDSDVSSGVSSPVEDGAPFPPEYEPEFAAAGTDDCPF